MTQTVSCVTFPRVPHVGCHHKTSSTGTSCIWSTSRQMVPCEWLPTNQTITVDQQVERVQQALKPKEYKELAFVNRKGLLFHHENTWPHIMRLTGNTGGKLSWLEDTLCHQSYFRDLAPTFDEPILFAGQQPSWEIVCKWDRSAVGSFRLLFVTTPDFYHQDITHLWKLMGGLFWGLAVSQIYHIYLVSNE